MIRMKNCVLAITLSGILLYASSDVVGGPSADTKNVLLILCDDMGAMELQCYGHPYNQTPNLDRLADEGVRFETFFATPVCSPTRVCLMTGKFGYKTTWLNMIGREPGAQQGDPDLSTDEYTVGQMFKDAGYDTYMAGKWQLTGRLPTMIHECGFDEYLAWIYKGDVAPGTEFVGGLYEDKSSRYWQPGVAKNGVHFATDTTDYGPDMFSDFLIESMGKSVKNGKPFLAYYPMVLMHTPWIATPDHPDIEGKNSDAAKQANVEYTDKIIGKLLHALDSLNIRENTLIVFIGDNGTQKWGKSSVTEWGVRTPCIVSCPGTVREEGASGELVHLADILTTILSFAGYTPENIKDLDGTDLMPHLESGIPLERDFIWSFYGQYRIIREKEWLLESNSVDGFGDLFYCGDLRNGLGYELITDFSPPRVQDAVTRFNGYIEQLPVPDFEEADRVDFADFVWKKKETMIENVTELYGYPYAQQTITSVDSRRKSSIMAFSDYLLIQLDNLSGNSMYTITDLNGKLVRKEKLIETDTYLFTGNFIQGFYLINISSDACNETYKLIINN